MDNKFNILYLLIPVILVIVVMTLSSRSSNTSITSNTQQDPSPTKAQVDNSNKGNNMNRTYSKAETVIDANKQYSAVIETTQGKMTVELNTKGTPITSNNFIFLAKEKFYDGTIFHRTINGFMIQGGDPTGTGAGGPGYQFEDEPFSGEYTRGTIAMANAGPDTNGSQFFIMHKDYALQPNYVIFGKVTEGLDVLDKIATAPVTRSRTGEMSQPVDPVEIVSVEIIER
jgi:cyclophilin family peptidyl-prolyl cis-trans isomerase